MSTFFDKPSDNWAYDAIAANYSIDNNISHVLLNIKKDLKRRVEIQDRDTAQVKWILKSDWQLVAAAYYWTHWFIPVSLLNSLVACQKRPSTPLPISQPSSPFRMTNILFEKDDELDMVTGIVLFDCPVIINDVVELQLESLPRQESRWLINEIDVSEKWHQFKEKLLKPVMKRGVFVESHVQQILVPIEPN
ncbi:hypothetical protein G9A89_007282 [Geosiphon pyriformis]|nr:hypothetical protein G9A89_007282 [Geosiphon pyriformis]